MFAFWFGWLFGDWWVNRKKFRKGSIDTEWPEGWTK